MERRVAMTMAHAAALWPNSEHRNRQSVSSADAVHQGGIRAVERRGEKPMTIDNSKGHEIVVHVTLPDDERARKPALAVYAFSRGGKLLDTKPVDASGDVTLKIALGAEGTEARVLLGPRLEATASSLAELTRRGALERHVRVEAGIKRPSLGIQVQIDKLLCWLRSICFVNGEVLKRTSLSGQHIDLPVCDASVEVYEVDPFFLVVSKLPDLVIDRLRDLILHPIPLPDPPPELLPAPFLGQFQAGPATTPFSAAAAKFAAAPPAGRSHTDAALALAAHPRADELRFAARSAANQELRRLFVERSGLIRPLLCVLYPHFFTMRLIGTARTDECGHFHLHFFRGCNNADTPDLYFKVKQTFFGLFDVTIYAPTPVPCYTHWNFACGSTVKLVTTHPLAHTCHPCAPVDAGENWVLFSAIGATSLNAIHGNSPALQATTTSTNRGLTKTGAPFGGALRPQLLFDNSLRESLNVKYYRLFWRRVGSPSWFQMRERVQRHYTHNVGGHPVSELYELGPLVPPKAPLAGLYEIPPALPPLGVWGPVIAPTDYQNGVVDTTLPNSPDMPTAPGISYGLDGSELGTDLSGKFEIKLELFDSAGGPVNIAALNIKYHVPNVDDLTGTITTTDAASLGLVSGNAMIIQVHVDNNPTYAEVDAPTIGATAADACCGVLGFSPGDNVTIPWRAKHKHGFATFDFTTKRVEQVVFQALGTPVGLTGNFSTTQGAQTLMDLNLPAGCAPGGCVTAAFASAVYVTAMATDGWQRLSGLDTFDFEAFALSKA
jgi:hypothetical protein